MHLIGKLAGGLLMLIGFIGGLVVVVVVWSAVDRTSRGQEMTERIRRESWEAAVEEFGAENIGPFEDIPIGTRRKSDLEVLTGLPGVGWVLCTGLLSGLLLIAIGATCYACCDCAEELRARGKVRGATASN